MWAVILGGECVDPIAGRLSNLPIDCEIPQHAVKLRRQIFSDSIPEDRMDVEPAIDASDSPGDHSGFGSLTIFQNTPDPRASPAQPI